MRSAARARRDAMRRQTNRPKRNKRQKGHSWPRRPKRGIPPPVSQEGPAMKHSPDFTYRCDYAIDRDTFLDILNGYRILARLDEQWATRRLLEYAPYGEMLRHLSSAEFARRWPGIRHRIRSESRRRGNDFLLKWPKDHQSQGLIDGQGILGLFHPKN